MVHELYWLLGGSALAFAASWWPDKPIVSRASLIFAWYLIYSIVHWAMDLAQSPLDYSREQYALAGAIVAVVTALLGWVQNNYRSYRVQTKQLTRSSQTWVQSGGSSAQTSHTSQVQQVSRQR